MRVSEQEAAKKPAGELDVQKGSKHAKTEDLLACVGEAQTSWTAE